MAEVRVRRGLESDISETDAIDKVCFKDLVGSATIGQQTGPAGIANMMKPSSLFLVAEIDSKVIGYALAWPHQHPRGSRALNLDLIAVLPKHRGRGAATALLNELVNVAAQRGYDLVVLTASDRSAGYFRQVGLKVADRNKALVWNTKPFPSLGSFGEKSTATDVVVYAPSSVRGYDFAAYFLLTTDSELNVESLSAKQVLQRATPSMKPIRRTDQRSIRKPA